MIRFENVKKSFGEKTVLNGLNFKINEGETTFILGKSGEGKSVTIKHFLGLLKADSGQVLIDDVDVGQLDKFGLISHRKQFGMLFQHAALFDSLTVEENVLFPLRENKNVDKSSIEERAEKTLGLVGLGDAKDLYPSSLSTGEKKRAGLARALVTYPRYLLYDEPTTGMDPIISQMIDDLILDVAKKNRDMTTIVISHDLSSALSVADQIIMIYKGKVILAGSPRDFRETSDPIIRQFFSGSIEGPMEFL